jgi:LTXXQ motif family protein
LLERQSAARSLSGDRAAGPKRIGSDELLEAQIMMRHTLLPFAALAALTFAPSAQAGSDQSSQPAMERMQHWAEDHEALLDAKLAGLRAGLRLTPDQDKLWPPFETAVRDAAKLHMEQMKSMMERMRAMHQMMEGMKNSDDMKDEDMKGMDAGGQAVSPIDRLDAMGQRMSDRGAAIKKVADAAKPLYASLDDSQKRRFALLGRALFMMGHGHHGMGMMHGRMGMMGGMMGEGMGMMGRKSDRMESMGHGHDEDEDNSDEE